MMRLDYDVTVQGIAELALEEIARKIKNKDPATLAALKEIASKHRPTPGSNGQGNQPS